ncbi:hypothetical protein BDZ97DRAFT_1755778 [Flammula alnicola]|nr:hypothetical protein BDZ97DRAFT_1755778 [Flammula alnicola]
MSAIRNNSNRAEARKQRSLPYSRAIVRPLHDLADFVLTKYVKANGISTFLRVFGLGEQVEDESESPKETQQTDRNAVNELTSSPSRSQDTNTFYAPANQSTFSSPRQPLVPVDFSNYSARTPGEPSSSSSSTIPDARSVATYFSQKTGTAVDANFVESIVTELQTTPEKPQKFRFTFTTPGRESSPFSLNPNITDASPSPSPRKKLARNPNGTYRWEGAGSAKQTRSRNRYASPAFSASPSKPERLIMKESTSLGEAPLTDSKRRKVGEAGSSSPRPAASESSGPSVPFPVTASPTTPRTNGTPTRPTTISSSTRLRTPAKPTAPVVPSPLRQAWSDASSTSSRDDSGQNPSHQTKQTKTANFMAELIKETTPPKKPDLSNPYQTASPVGKVGPPRRGTKRQRATGRPAAPTKEQRAEEEKRKQEEEKQKKLKEYSPQAIIEATVPKGSKRSRPPARFEKAVSDESLSDITPPAQREAPVVVETRKATYIVEEVSEDDEEAQRSAKRSKPFINGNGLPSTLSKKASTPPDSDITIEEVGDVIMHDSSKEQNKANGNLKETPKLTNGNISAAAAASASSPTSRSSFSGLKSIPKEPSKLRFSFQAEGSSAPSSPAPASLPLPSPPTLPKTEFKFTPPSTGFNFSFKAADKETSDASKPTVSKKDVAEVKPLGVEEIKAKVRAMDAKSLPIFSFTFTATSVLPNTADHVRARSDAKVLPPSSLPKFDFAEAKAGSPSAFKFDLSGSKTPSSFSSFGSPSPSLGGFTLANFGASASADASKAASRFDPGPVKGFDFTAAGMKMPEVKKDHWTCSLCGLSNPKAASQCETCETPAPSGTSAAPAPVPSKPLDAYKPPAPPVKGFDFAAAGMKMPTVSKGKWSCSLCGLSNPDSASKCETCETPK